MTRSAATDPLILAIDTASSAGSAALLRDDHIEVERFFDTGLQHSKRLLVEVDELMHGACVRAAELDAVAVTIGPGSFTGLRIGLAAAKGLCLAAEASLLTVSTLEVAAARLPFCSDPVCVVLDARRDEYYAGLFDTSSGRPHLLSPPRALGLAELLDSLRDRQKVLFTGGGCANHLEDLAGFSGGRVAPPHCSRPTAGAVGWLAAAMWAAGDVADLASVEPDYLRHPTYARAGNGQAQQQA